jgi:hypothetical protein
MVVVEKPKPWLCLHKPMTPRAMYRVVDRYEEIRDNRKCHENTREEETMASRQPSGCHDQEQSEQHVEAEVRGPRQGIGQTARGHRFGTLAENRYSARRASGYVSPGRKEDVVMAMVMDLVDSA